jgi:hypothetical protein
MDERSNVADNSRAINRVFTRGVIEELLQNRSNNVFDYVVRRYVNDPETKTHGELISEIYAYLGKEQRNEYYYTNTLLNKLLKIHSVNTTTVLSQVRIGHHVADFVMINGEGEVYEIKSELDNFDRLRSQISDYYKAFNKVSVLSSIHDLVTVEKTLSNLGTMGESVGIYVLSDNDTIPKTTHGRKPKHFNECLDHACIFKLLRKREYENILTQYFDKIPQVAPVFHFKKCLEQFRQIPILTAQDLAFKELKKRNKISKTVFDKIQIELKSVIYFSGLSRKLQNLEQLLQTKYTR